MRRSAVLSPPLAALAALLGLAPSARAADVPYILHGPRCPLPYTPYTQELATAPELVCRLDADDDGIDDAIENLVAECFMPMFRFDTAENALRTWPAPAGAPPGSAATEEPRAVFSVDPVLPGASVPVPSAARRRAQVKYTFLWDRDAGWHRLEGPAAEVPAQSRDAHLGDSQSILATVDLVGSASGGWYAELISLDNFGYVPGGRVRRILRARRR